MTVAGRADELRVLEAQLGRMRGMVYRYYELFLRFIVAGLAGIAILFVGSFFAPTQAAALLLPFAVIFVGFHAAYLFSYVIFARTYAAALERRINALLGTEALVAHRLEEVWFGAPGDRRIVAASLRAPLGMLAAETWHFTIAGAALFGVSVLIGTNTAGRVGEPWSQLYLPVAVGWAVLNGLYLAWHFLGRRDQRRIQAILDEAHPGPMPTPDAAPVEPRPRGEPPTL